MIFSETPTVLQTPFPSDVPLTASLACVAPAQRERAAQVHLRGALAEAGAGGALLSQELAEASPATRGSKVAEPGLATRRGPCRGDG